LAEPFVWLKPSPLWPGKGAEFLASDFEPQLLEFTSDSFMEEFMAMAASSKPDALRKAVPKPPDSGNSLKFFQPAHGRFYLVCASLCCQQPGFPWRQVRYSEGESAFFILRKLGNDGEEYGWIAEGPVKGWRSLGDNPRRVLSAEKDNGDEERLPLFPVTAGNQQSILFGYVAVASSETYGVAASEATGDSKADTRIEELKARFTNPVSSLAGVNVVRLSVFLILDLWEFLLTYLQDVAEALRDGTVSSLTGPKADLVDFLQRVKLGGTLTLAAALGSAARSRKDLNALGDDSLPSAFGSDYDLRHLTGTELTSLTGAVQAALPSQETQIEVPKFSPQAGDLYALRCVYDRPPCCDCKPREYTISRRSQSFQLAPFYDPEAPARKIRIGLPVDVSISGLRKFQKGVAFMISKSLRNKLARITGKEKEILSGGSIGSEGTLDLDQICSFSIPIITLCAFILLMIIVVLLNIVFWWLPFFKICFPLKFSSK
jgi:hypothetical protein